MFVFWKSNLQIHSPLQMITPPICHFFTYCFSQNMVTQRRCGNFIKCSHGVNRNPSLTTSMAAFRSSSVHFQFFLSFTHVRLKSIPFIMLALTPSWIAPYFWQVLCERVLWIRLTPDTCPLSALVWAALALAILGLGVIHQYYGFGYFFNFLLHKPLDHKADDLEQPTSSEMP